MDKQLHLMSRYSSCVSSKNPVLEDDIELINYKETISYRTQCKNG